MCCRSFPWLCGKNLSYAGNMRKIVRYAGFGFDGRKKLIHLTSPLSKQDGREEFRDHLLIAISQAGMSGFEGTKKMFLDMLKDVESEMQSTGSSD